MKIHEYQSKALLRQFNVKVPRGKEAYSVEKAVWVADDLGGPSWVLKAQIHAGGRGKGGGVKVAHSIDEVRKHARHLLGMRLVTPQTGPEGRTVKKIHQKPDLWFVFVYRVSIVSTMDGPKKRRAN